MNEVTTTVPAERLNTLREAAMARYASAAEALHNSAGSHAGWEYDDDPPTGDVAVTTPTDTLREILRCALAANGDALNHAAQQDEPPLRTIEGLVADVRWIVDALGQCGVKVEA
jgi:hypothetical protein